MSRRNRVEYSLRHQGYCAHWKQWFYTGKFPQEKSEGLYACRAKFYSNLRRWPIDNHDQHHKNKAKQEPEWTKIPQQPAKSSLCFEFTILWSWNTYLAISNCVKKIAFLSLYKFNTILPIQPHNLFWTAAKHSNNWHPGAVGLRRTPTGHSLFLS